MYKFRTIRSCLLTGTNKRNGNSHVVKVRYMTVSIFIYRVHGLCVWHYSHISLF